MVRPRGFIRVSGRGFLLECAVFLMYRRQAVVTVEKCMIHGLQWLELEIIEDFR